jgi:type I restriction enzyme M protein
MLFTPYHRKEYSTVTVPQSEIKGTIFDHPEFTSFHKSVTRLFANWKTIQTPVLKDMKVGAKPKLLIQELSEDLLATFQKARLVDPYDVYQHLMDYWAETMQDDVYLLAKEGWKAVIDGHPSTDLIPPTLIVNRYFAADQAAINQMEVDREAILRQIEELDEEHGGEDGLLAEAKNDKGNLSKASVKARLEEIVSDPDLGDERKLLRKYLQLVESEAAANKKMKAAVKALDVNVAAQYGKLNKDEIKALVVDDKWIATLSSVVHAELNRVSQALAGRIKQLAERYDAPLPNLTNAANELSTRVNTHLTKMGFSWK